MKILKYLFVVIILAIYSTVISSVFYGLMDATATQGIAGTVLFIFSAGYLLELLEKFCNNFDKHFNE